MKNKLPLIASGALLALSVAFAGSANASLIGISLSTNASDTSLTSSLAGTSITSTGTDTWTVNYDNTVLGSALGGFTDGSSFVWQDAAGNYDNLQWQSGNTYLFTSDAATPGVNNNCTSIMPEGTTCALGQDASFNTYYVTAAVDPVAAPEPSALGMLAIGLIGIAFLARRRKFS